MRGIGERQMLSNNVMKLSLSTVGLCLSLSNPCFADNWTAYGHDLHNTRYSPLVQINPTNVNRLKVAWVFHTGDISDGKHGVRRSGLETTPLMIAGRLYLTTAFNRIIALDPATGHQLWAYDPHIKLNQAYGDGLINRGMAAWRDRERSAGACGLRLFEATLDARLIAVDGTTGKPCEDFGAHGEVDLRNVPHYKAGVYHLTSPPIVLDGVVVAGSAINDNEQAEMPDGVVRGFDADTGKLLWSWEPLKRPPNDLKDWRTGAANAWSILGADPKRHLIYIPTGSASPDYYGGLRPGYDRWADSVVALDSRTGRLVWGFQLVHHDLWDYDTTAAPLITSFKFNGRSTPILIAGNKSGMIFVLDPSTGKAIMPIEEHPVPQNTVPGETASPTQPFSTALPSLIDQELGSNDAWGLTFADRNACKARLESLSPSALFSPPNLNGQLTIPGPLGGINWSGFSWDAKDEWLIVPVTHLPYEIQLIPAEAYANGTHGKFEGEIGPQRGTPYIMVRAPLKAPSGMLCAPPPWGELVALDLASGKIVWRNPIGNMRDVFANAASIKGSVILGGPIVTAGGLVFIGGTMDRQFHALSSLTGKELWTALLPASAHASPITYEIGGKQYVVIAAGGSAKIDEEKQGDSIVAYALQ